MWIKLFQLNTFDVCPTSTVHFHVTHLHFKFKESFLEKKITGYIEKLTVKKWCTLILFWKVSMSFGDCDSILTFIHNHIVHKLMNKNRKMFKNVSFSSSFSFHDTILTTPPTTKPPTPRPRSLQTESHKFSNGQESRIFAAKKNPRLLRSSIRRRTEQSRSSEDLAFAARV